MPARSILADWEMVAISGAGEIIGGLCALPAHARLLPVVGERAADPCLPANVHWAADPDQVQGLRMSLEVAAVGTAAVPGGLHRMDIARTKGD